MGDISPADGMIDPFYWTVREYFIRDAVTKIAKHANIAARERRERPAKFSERLANDRNVLRWISQQVCADPIHRGGIRAGE